MLKPLILSASLIAGANAFWRMECPGRVGLARLDPIINPGEDSAHAHAIHGSSAFSESSNTADLQGGSCTSCRVTQDKSAYWHPAVYFQDSDTGKIELVPQVGGMLAYYLLYGNNVTAFPSGFKMISGDNERRTYTLGDASQPDPPKSQWASMGQTTQQALAQRALGFNCLNYAKDPEATLYRHRLPDKAYLDQNCANGLRFELMFPSCWNGKDLDSPNHKDHVAFPDLVMTGTCPESHPVRLPSMLYEVIWNTAAFKGRNGRFTVSNGDTTGFGYHGDFITGWETNFLQSAINTCTNPSGRIQDCPLFNVVDEGQATSCQMRKSPLQALFAENVLGPMAKLPGNIEVGGSASHGPAPAKSSPGPNLTYRPGEKPSDPAAPLPGQAFKEKAKSGSSAPTAPPPPPPPPPASTSTVVTPAPPPPAALPTFYSTQYITSGTVVKKILWVESVVTVTDFGGQPAEATPAAAAPAGHKHRRHAARHAHVHGKF